MGKYTGKHIISQLPYLYLFYLFRQTYIQIGSPALTLYPVSSLHKSISGRHRPVRVADGPMTARCRFTKNASWVVPIAAWSTLFAIHLAVLHTQTANSQMGSIKC